MLSKAEPANSDAALYGAVKTSSSVETLVYGMLRYFFPTLTSVYTVGYKTVVFFFFLPTHHPPSFCLFLFTFAFLHSYLPYLSVPFFTDCLVNG